MKKQHSRRWQRLLIYLICIGVFALLWPFLRMQTMGNFWQSMRFKLPDVPSWIEKNNDWQQPKLFFIELATDSPEVLQNLKSAGFLANINGRVIMVGPYLMSFKAQVDINKISQIAGSSVKIHDWDF